tara:strand:- start:1365 stop:1898 length:534 start_codon:yes stop_codon:yes gene_type:complete
VKKIFVVLICLPISAKDLYITRSGSVSFYSHTIIEDIIAVNKQTSCILDLETGSLAFQVPIRGFVFPNALMQEHFNESYMESHKFPRSTFKGNIENWLELDLGPDPKDVLVNGILTIHGVSREISESGTIAIVSNGVNGLATFEVAPSDFGIEIPKIVRNNIARSIQITVNVKLKQK